MLEKLEKILDKFAEIYDSYEIFLTYKVGEKTVFGRDERNCAFIICCVFIWCFIAWPLIFHFKQKHIILISFIALVVTVIIASKFLLYISNKAKREDDEFKKH